MPLTWLPRLLDVAFGVAIGWWLTTRRVRSDGPATHGQANGIDVAPAATDGPLSAGPFQPQATPAYSEIPGENPTPVKHDPVSLQEALRRALEAPRQQNATSHAGSSTADADPHEGMTAPHPNAANWAARPLYGVGGLRLAPPPPPGSDTPAHLVLRLGNAPESPIHSTCPDDWEELPGTSEPVLLAPRGYWELLNRTYEAFHLRKAFRRVK